MSLKIRVFDGPQAGQVLEFGDDVTVVNVGREADCQVRFAPTDTRVGRHHCSIRRELGRYVLETNADNLVKADGRPVPHDVEHALPADCELQLGEDGPKLKVDRVLSSTLPATERKGDTISVADTSRRNSALLAVAMVLIAALVGGWVWHQSRIVRIDKSVLQHSRALNEQDARIVAINEGSLRLKTTVDELKESGVEGLRTAVTSVGPSVYLVLAKDKEGGVATVGTAWVADKSKGLLASNAHVVAAFDQLPDGSRLIARSNSHRSGTPVDHVVTRVQKHPGYDAFEAMTSLLEPKRMGLFGAEENVEFITSCDVGLMWVDQADALEASLKLADLDTLHGLQPGASIAFVGYPMEGLVGGGVDATNPTPTVQFGNITAITDPFLGKGTPESRVLIQHNLPAAGGASGSPIVDPKGAVVGLLSAGNIVATPGGRAPSAVQINFAQRSDLLRELLEGTYDAEQQERVAGWQTALATFQTQTLESWLAKLREGFAEEVAPAAVQVVREASVELGPDRAYEDEVSVVASGVHLFVATADTFDNIDMKLSTPAGTEIGKDVLPDSFPLVQAEVSSGDEVHVSVTGPKAGVKMHYLVLAAEGASLGTEPASGEGEEAGDLTLAWVISQWDASMAPATLREVLARDVTLGPRRADGGALEMTIEVDQPGWYFLGAEAANREDIDLAVVDEAGQPMALDAATDHVPVGAVAVGAASKLKLILAGPEGTRARVVVRGAVGTCGEKAALNVVVYSDDEDRARTVARAIRDAGYSQVAIDTDVNDFTNVKWGCAAPAVIDEIAGAVRQSSGAEPQRMLLWGPQDPDVYVNVPSTTGRGEPRLGAERR